MADVEIYNGVAKIAEMSDSGQKTLKTAEKYNQNDIVVKFIKEGGLPEGITAIATGTFTPTSSVNSYTITHNLGVKPKFIAVIPTTGYAEIATSLHIGIWNKDKSVVRGFRSATQVNQCTTGSPLSSVTTTRATVNTTNIVQFHAGEEYRWFAIA